MSSRVLLRTPRPEDRAAWCDLVRASGGFYAGRITTRGTAAAFRAYLARAKTPTAACRLIWRRSDDALLGAINISEIIWGFFKSGYLGYYIGEGHAGQGYMTEALAGRWRDHERWALLADEWRPSR